VAGRKSRFAHHFAHQYDLDFGGLWWMLMDWILG
jgi:hypothetical protein